VLQKLGLGLYTQCVTVCVAVSVAACVAEAGAA